MADYITAQQERVCGRRLNLSGNGVEGHEPVEQIYGDHFERLQRNKHTYDPEGVFNRWHVIPAAVTPI
jgi:FAD/FMN-containing dehydrogenase